MSVFDALVDQTETISILKAATYAAKNNEDESQKASRESAAGRSHPASLFRIPAR